MRYNGMDGSDMLYCLQMKIMNRIAWNTIVSIPSHILSPIFLSPNLGCIQ